MEAGLTDHAGTLIGLATMSFAVLPRRDANPEVAPATGTTTMAVGASRLGLPLPDALGVTVVDAARGVVEAPVLDWSRNSMGAMQGGVVATVAELAAEHAVRAATGEPLVVTDLHVTYLGFGRAGPVRSAAEVLASGDGHATARVELVDAGAEHRAMTVVHAVATRCPS